MKKGELALKLRANGKTNAEIANILGMKQSSVRRLLSEARQVAPEAEVQESPDDRRAEDLRRALVHVQRQLAKAKERTEDLVEATVASTREATLALGPVPPVPVPVKDSRKGAEAALWHMTDWQGAKVTTSYNSDVMRERVMLFCEKAARITNIQRADHPVNHCVIAFGGDMVEGLFNFPGQAFEIDSTIFAQFVSISRLEVDVVRYALSVYETVEVVAEWGNHGRIGSKRDTVPRSDNIDRMTYELARQLLAGESRLKWNDCPEDVQRIEIGNYRALLMHGDEVGRNGFASPNTIVQHVNRWRSGAYPWAFRDVYVGHYHTHNEWSMANGEGSVYQTGSTESDNRYAGVMLASSAKPSQRVHFIDPEVGRVTAGYKVWLD
jgi:predicted transcriptional regulator